MTGDRPLPPPREWNKNLSDFAALLEVSQYHVATWGPGRDGKGKQEQVHILIDLGKELDGMTFALRLKSRAAVRQLAALLLQYADEVWPP